LRLVACSNCHAQYDVSSIIVEEFPCRCGETVQNRDLKGIEVAVHRCASCGAIVTDPSVESCSYCSAQIQHGKETLSLICPECFARNPDDSRFCIGCGVGFHPEPIQTQGEELPCPSCEALMPARDLAGVSLNECTRCQGLWVPGAYFDVLIDRAIETRKANSAIQTGSAAPRVTGGNPARQQVQYRRCPDCGDFMHRKNYRKRSGIIIDRCTDHGVWLDADELEQIAGFVLSGGLVDAPSREQERKREAEARAAVAFQHAIAEETPWARPMQEKGVLGFLADVLQVIVRTY